MTTTKVQTVIEQLREWASTLDKPMWNQTIDIQGVIRGLSEVANGLECEILPPAIIREDELGHKELVCPHCGEADNFSYFEDICNSRSVNGIVVTTDETLLEIEGFYETDGCDEGGDNGRLSCQKCYSECAIPDALEVEFV